MRRFTFLVLCLLVSSLAWGQSQRLVSPEQQVSADISERIQARNNLQEAALSNGVGFSSRVPVGTVRSSNVTATKIGEATNGFSALSTQVNALNVDNTYGAVFAIHRSNTATCGGTSGDYRYAFSTDGGINWSNNSVSGCFGFGPLNTSNANNAGRYPSIFAFNPNGSASAADLNLVFTGRVIGSTTWEGNVTGAVNDPTNFVNQSTNVTQEFYPMANSLESGSFNMTERVEGEYWVPSLVDEGPEDGVTVIRRGIYNNTTNQLSWSIMDTVRYDDSVLFNGFNHTMAFSPDGQHGYLVSAGDVFNGEPLRDSTLGVLVSESHDGGQTWTNWDEIDLSGFTALYDSLSAFWVFNDTANNVVVPATSGKPICWATLDVTVDKNGDPHIITWFGNNTFWSSADSAYQSPGYTIYFGLRKYVVDLTKDNTGNWNGIFINDLNTFDADFGGLAGIDSYTQASRSEDGRYIFFSYTDTDTIGNFQDNDNSAPNMITVGYDVDTRTMTQLNNRTLGDPNWDGLALLPTVAPVALNGGGDTVLLPTMISDFETGDGAGKTNFWYFSDVAVDTATEFTEPAIFFNNCFDFAAAFTSSEPTCNNADGSLTVNPAGGQAPYSYSWTGAGAAGNITQTVSGLAPGQYTATVTDNVGCETTVSFTLESVGAATLALADIEDITCAGDGNGTAVVVPTGGTAPYTYSWSNGETGDTAVALPAGVTTVEVTDANGCVSFTDVTIDEPAEIEVLTVLDGTTTCEGDTDGEVFVEAAGGTGNLSYQWANGSAGQSLTALDSGTYVVTITDANGCTETAEAIVSYPDPVEITASELLPNSDPNSPDGAINVAYDSQGNGPNFTIVARLISSNGIAQDTVLANVTSDNTTDEQLLFLCGGDYEITVTDANGCQGVDTTTISGEPCAFATSNISKAGLSSLTIFPNPTSGMVEVELNMDQARSLKLEIFNAQGQLIEQQSEDMVSSYNTRFNLADQAAGIYLLRVSTPQGVETHRIVRN